MSIAEQLKTDVAPELVSERKGLSYITGRYVKARLNELFGWDGWDFIVKESYQLHRDEEAIQWYVHGTLTIRLQDQDEDRWVRKDGIAIGHGTLKNWEGEAVSAGRANEVADFAAAEAVTDALKRAAVSLGETLGLGLYHLVAENGKKKGGGSTRVRTAKNSNKPFVLTDKSTSFPKTKAPEEPEADNDKTKGPKRAKKF